MVGMLVVLMGYFISAKGGPWEKKNSKLRASVYCLQYKGLSVKPTALTEFWK